MRRFFVRISDPAFSTLADRADHRRRDVRDEAAISLERALGAAEFDPEHDNGRDVGDHTVEEAAS